MSLDQNWAAPAAVSQVLRLRAVPSNLTAVFLKLKHDILHPLCFVCFLFFKKEIIEHGAFDSLWQVFVVCNYFPVSLKRENLQVLKSNSQSYYLLPQGWPVTAAYKVGSAMSLLEMLSLWHHPDLQCEEDLLLPWGSSGGWCSVLATLSVQPVPLGWQESESVWDQQLVCWLPLRVMLVTPDVWVSV